ncbi:hypothetical protein D2Q93_05740 [Alicyclobacillaceae bacterium I2511]|nr:hypothetical protein D2Q93_05740 [Alicyclobacillaceae bacterium I2511]
MERPAGELLFQFTFIVTHMMLQPKKEAKNGFACDKMSSTDFASNAVKLQIAMLAYHFNNWFRRLCLPEKMKSARMETLRTKLVKIAGKLVYSGRYWTWKLCSSCVNQKEFIQTIHNVTRLPRFG